MNKNIYELQSYLINGKIPTNFEGTVEDVEETLRDEIKKLVGNYDLYRRNKLDLFELIQSTIDDVLPNKIISIFGQFAETQQFAQGDKPRFHRVLGKARAKQFVTKVGPAATYETFRLDREWFEIDTYAIGGAVRIDFERYLDGLDNLMDLYDIVVERMSDIIYEEIQKCLLASFAATRPSRNKVTANHFDASAMLALCNTVSAYGAPVIMAPPQFAAEMTNEITYITSVKGMTPAATKNIPDADVAEIRETGYIGKFHGYPVVVLPQSFEDESNQDFVVDPRVAYVLPAGKNKIVKIAFEGQTIVDDFKNKGDRSMEIQVYKKMGIGIVTPMHCWGIYKNTGIVDATWSAKEAEYEGNLNQYWMK